MQEWVNVNERKPDTRKDLDTGALKSDEVLGVTKYGYFTIVRYVEYEDGECFFEDGETFEQDITHWMLLPEPPKKG